MPLNITFSSELMTNYKQFEVANPEKKFKVLESEAGDSLLFSLGTDNALYLIKENTAASSTGWEKINISNIVCKDGNKKYPVKTFEVGQNVLTRKITLLMVVTKQKEDHVYISENNIPNAQLGQDQLSWTLLKFDDINRESEFSLQVSGIYVSETAKGQLIVVDALRNPADAVKYIYRYYIDPKKTTGNYWIPQDVTTDMEANKIVTCIGRKNKGRVDGIYTLGEIKGIKELLYQPIYNAYSKTGGIAPSSRLLLPQKSTPTALATLPTKNGLYTDLFVAGKGSLYYFPHDSQNDNDSGVCIFEHAIFDDVTHLFADRSKDNKIIVWGVNRAKKLFYITCKDEEITKKTEWSFPLPILSNVQQITPYINQKLNINTFFAHTGENRFMKAVQNPVTTLWSYYAITLAPDKDTKAVAFNSYTTRIIVEKVNGEPVEQGTEIKLSTYAPQNVYINNQYYVLNTTPLSIPLDESGTLNIVEKADSLRATCFRVHDGENIIAINPMSKPFEKLKALSTKDGLSKAIIKNDEGTTKRSLVKDGITDRELKAAAAAIKKILDIEDTLPDDGSVQKADHSTRRRSKEMPEPELLLSVNIKGNSIALAQNTAILSNISKAIEVAAGDVYCFLLNGAEYAINFLKDKINDTWIFLLEIGGAIYRFVIDCAEKVAGAIEVIFNAIKTAIKDVIQYAKFLFDWQDCIRTKDVMKSFFNLQLQDNINTIKGTKKDIEIGLKKLKDQIALFANIEKDTWSRTAPELNKTFMESGNTEEKKSVTSSPGSFLMNHLKNNLDKATFLSSSKGLIKTSINAIEDLISIITNALSNQGSIFLNTVSQIKKELLEGGKFKQMSILDIIKKLFGILSYTILNTAENILGFLIDIIVLALSTALDILNQPIKIPVISDILEKVIGKEINISLLDIIFMVVAVPTTIIYKIAKGKAPFTKEDGFSQIIIDSKSFEEVKTKLTDKNAVHPFGIDDSRKKASVPLITPSKGVQEVIFSICHYFAGAAAILSAPIVAVAQCFDNTPQTISDIVFYFNIAITVGEVVADKFAGLHAIDNPTFNTISTLLSTVSLATTVTFFVLKKKFVDKDNIENFQMFVEGAIAGLKIIPIGYHIYELSQKKNTKNRNLTILNNCSQISKNLSKITKIGAKKTNGKPRIVLAVSSGVLVGTYGVLQIIVGTN